MRLHCRCSRLLWQLLLLPLLLLPAVSLAAAAHAAAVTTAPTTNEPSTAPPIAPPTAPLTAATAAAFPAPVPTTDAAWEREMTRALAALRRGPHTSAGLAAATATAATAATAAVRGGWAPPALVAALARQALSWRGVLRGSSCAASGGDDDAPRARKKRQRRAGGGGGGGGGGKGGPSDARVAWEGRDAWGEPPDPLHGGEAPYAYRSGAFALRGECLGSAHPEHARWLSSQSRYHARRLSPQARASKGLGSPHPPRLAHNSHS